MEIFDFTVLIKRFIISKIKPSLQLNQNLKLKIVEIFQITYQLSNLRIIKR